MSIDQLTQTVAALFYHIRVWKLLCLNSSVISDGLLYTHLLRFPNMFAVCKALFHVINIGPLQHLGKEKLIRIREEITFLPS